MNGPGSLSHHSLMARVALGILIWVLAVPCFLRAVARHSPQDDEQLQDFLAGKDHDVTPLHNLARRAASGYKPRHLRVASLADSLPSKRDSITGPDVGQIANFHGSDPQPERGPLGASFLSNSNHELDLQNLDNVAGPTTDAGIQLRVQRFDQTLLTLFVGTVPNLKWSMSLSHTRLLKVRTAVVMHPAWSLTYF